MSGQNYKAHKSPLLDTQVFKQKWQKWFFNTPIHGEQKKLHVDSGCERTQRNDKVTTYQQEAKNRPEG